MGVKFDISSLKDFKKSLEAFDKDRDEILKAAINDISNRTLRLAMKRTPVDTGFLREGWYLGPIKRNGNSYEVEVENNTEYAEYVEYGHRQVINGVTLGWTKGQFMLTISINLIEEEIENIVNRSLSNSISRRFKWF